MRWNKNRISLWIRAKDMRDKRADSDGLVTYVAALRCKLIRKTCLNMLNQVDSYQQIKGLNFSNLWNLWSRVRDHPISKVYSYLLHLPHRYRMTWISQLVYLSQPCSLRAKKKLTRDKKTSSRTKIFEWRTSMISVRSVLDPTVR